MDETDGEVQRLLYGDSGTDIGRRCPEASRFSNETRSVKKSAKYSSLHPKRAGDYLPLCGVEIADSENILDINDSIQEICAHSKRTVDSIRSQFEKHKGEEKVLFQLNSCKTDLEKRLCLLLDERSGVDTSSELQMLLDAQEHVNKAVADFGEGCKAAFADCPPDSEYFQVYLTSDTLDELAANNISTNDYALKFGYLVSTAEPGPQSRSFTFDGVARFFDCVAKGHTTVVGFNEFAYSEGGRLIDYERLIEREYWVKVRNDPVRVILHVHYLGRWSRFLNGRDRSLITAVNLRHAVPKGNPMGVAVFHAPCKALGLWRENRKFKVDLGPGGPWDWKRDRARHPALHGLLLAAERCARRVRSPVRRAMRCGASDDDVNNSENNNK